MADEPTTLSPMGSALVAALQRHYEVDPKALFDAAGLDISYVVGTVYRYPISKTRKVWQMAEEVTGDKALGLVVGRYARATDIHSVGFGMLAAHSVRDALQRLVRYRKALHSTLELELVREGDTEALVVLTDISEIASIHGIDAFFASLLKFCTNLYGPGFRFVRVELTRSKQQPARYEEAFGCPVEFDASRNAVVIESKILDSPLASENRDLAFQSDRIIEQYIASLNPDETATKVREMLLELLPSGEASGDVIARKLNKSMSSLQRALRAEGTSYRDLLEDTRRSLAEQYIAAGKYNLVQIAYLLGFADQSNFTRAFKRWTGMSPSEFRAHRAPGAAEKESGPPQPGSSDPLPDTTSGDQTST